MVLARTEAMKILSVNVGLPTEVAWQGKLVTTGIFKEPMQARTMMRRFNLDGLPSRSDGPWRDEQGRLCIPVRALSLLAKRTRGEGSALGNVRRKFHDRGI